MAGSQHSQHAVSCGAYRCASYGCPLLSMTLSRSSSFPRIIATALANDPVLTSALPAFLLKIPTWACKCLSRHSSRSRRWRCSHGPRVALRSRTCFSPSRLNLLHGLSLCFNMPRCCRCACSVRLGDPMSRSNLTRSCTPFWRFGKVRTQVSQPSASFALPPPLRLGAQRQRRQSCRSRPHSGRPHRWLQNWNEGPLPPIAQEGNGAVPRSTTKICS